VTLIIPCSSSWKGHCRSLSRTRRKRKLSKLYDRPQFRGDYQWQAQNLATLPNNILEADERGSVKSRLESLLFEDQHDIPSLVFSVHMV